MSNLADIDARLQKVAKLPKINPQSSIADRLKRSGFSRRDFMKWAGAMTAMLGLPAAFTPSVARAAELTDRLPVIWLHMAECTGCSESLLRTDTPSIDSLIFDFTSVSNITKRSWLPQAGKQRKI